MRLMRVSDPIARLASSSDASHSAMALRESKTTHVASRVSPRVSPSARAMARNMSRAPSSPRALPIARVRLDTLSFGIPVATGAPRERRGERVDDRQRAARDVRAEVTPELTHHPRVMREVLLRAHQAHARVWPGPAAALGRATTMPHTTQRALE